MSQARRHIHKYIRQTLSFGRVWACALPECTHYMPQHMEDLVRNKKSICWDCNEPVAIMDEVNWKDTHPTCDSCRAIRATQNRSSEIRVDKSSLEDYVKILEKRKEDEKLEDIPGL